MLSLLMRRNTGIGKVVKRMSKKTVKELRQDVEKADIAFEKAAKRYRACLNAKKLAHDALEKQLLVDKVASLEQQLAETKQAVRSK